MEDLSDTGIGSTSIVVWRTDNGEIPIHRDAEAELSAGLRAARGRRDPVKDRVGLGRGVA